MTFIVDVATATTERFAQTLQRATLAQLDEALTCKRMTARARDMVRAAHAMVHGDVEVADAWMQTCPELMPALTDEEGRLARMIDVIAETV